MDSSSEIRSFCTSFLVPGGAAYFIFYFDFIFSTGDKSPLEYFGKNTELILKIYFVCSESFILINTVIMYIACYACKVLDMDDLMIVLRLCKKD